MRATIVRANGTVVTVVSKPGEELSLEIPSGGFYAMTGPGRSKAAPRRRSARRTPKCAPMTGPCARV